MVVFGSLSLLSVFFNIVMPETKDCDLPEGVTAANLLGKYVDLFG